MLNRLAVWLVFGFVLSVPGVAQADTFRLTVNATIYSYPDSWRGTCTGYDQTPCTPPPSFPSLISDWDGKTLPAPLPKVTFRTIVTTGDDGSVTLSDPFIQIGTRVAYSGGSAVYAPFFQRGYIHYVVGPPVVPVDHPDWIDFTHFDLYWDDGPGPFTRESALRDIGGDPNYEGMYGFFPPIPPGGPIYYYNYLQLHVQSVQVSDLAVPEPGALFITMVGLALTVVRRRR